LREGGRNFSDTNSVRCTGCEKKNKSRLAKVVYGTKA